MTAAIPSFEAIRPAAVQFDEGGVPRSALYDDVYASSHGALAQARHVFLAGNNLPARWSGVERFAIVETGFGAGLNFLAAWQALREDTATQARLHFVSVEKHPLAAADLRRVHERYPELGALSSQLIARYPALLPGFHRLHLDGGRVTLTLLFGEGESLLTQLQAGADAFFLDGFAPAKNPQLWTPAIFAELARLANPGATFATWSVAAAVCDGLERAGFATAKRPGFASKRDMLCGHIREAISKNTPATRRDAIVIGAGLAGTSVAQRLAHRGWRVQVLERHDAPAREASGNPAGLVRPVFSPDWNTHSRFTSAAFLYACRHDADLNAAGRGAVHGEGGVLQFARDAARFAKQQQMLERFALPADVVSLVTQAEARERAGVPVAGPASFFPGAFWADPATMCEANLAAAGEAVERRFGIEVTGLRRVAGNWEVLGSGNEVVANAPVVVLANAWLANRFPQAASLPLRPVRGQVSLIPARADRRLQIAVCGDGYITPAIAGQHCFGASFNEDMAETALREEDHASNLRRLDMMLPGFGEGIAPASLDGRVAFRAMSRDRLPLLGAIDGEEGLFACLALGSRGMTWAALAAEIVASRICGDPMPVGADLLRALDAARFAPVRAAGVGA